MPNHVVSADPTDFPETAGPDVAGRAMLVRATAAGAAGVRRARLPVRRRRGPSTRSTGTVAGRALPAGLRQAERLPEPLFTPTTKADAGHDLPLADAEAADAGRRRPSTSSCATLTLAIYEFGAAHAAERGLILADTKFEFGERRRRAPA